MHDTRVVKIFTPRQEARPSDIFESLDEMVCQLQSAIDQGLAPRSLQGPIFVLWEITGNCPQHCIYCYNSSPKVVEEMSGRRMFELADEVIEAKVFSVCLSGGEPMARPEYLDLMEYLASSGVSIGTVISGGFMTKAAVGRIARYASTVQVSLDGSTPEIHDRVRGRKGSFIDAVNAIRSLRAEGKAVQVAFAATKFNIEDLPRVHELCGDLGVSTLRAQKLVAGGNGHKSGPGIHATEAQYGEMIRFFAENAAGNPSTLYSDPTTHIRFGQEHGLSIVARITAEGYLSPSPYLDTFFGDLKRETLRSAWSRMKRGWEHPELQEFLKTRVVCKDGVISVDSDGYLFIGKS